MSSDYTPKTAMFIFAHPDDIEFGVAGTAAKWTRAGSRVIYVVITDGNVGSHEDGMTPEKLAEIRRAEQTSAADVAGAECIFLGYHDGFLQPTLELRKDLVRLIRRYKPNAVVCTDPTNFFPSDDYINHPDHRAAGTAALDAVFPAAEMTMLYPDLAAEGLVGHKVNDVFVTFGARKNYYVDITDTIELKIEALNKHVSQVGGSSLDEMIRQWAAEAGKQVGFDYAEGFYRITLRPMETPGVLQPES
ncbi:MAG: PIG-L family deacetylase [Anaerolineae bacterium]|nr:PIG-L family deacetylase [Anaerolineae bacterium]